jgi:hypothetical protein
LPAGRQAGIRHDGYGSFHDGNIRLPVRDTRQGVPRKNGKEERNAEKPGKRVFPKTPLKDEPAEDNIQTVRRSDYKLADPAVGKFQRGDSVSQPEEETGKEQECYGTLRNTGADSQEKKREDRNRGKDDQDAVPNLPETDIPLYEDPRPAREHTE